MFSSGLLVIYRRYSFYPRISTSLLSYTSNLLKYNECYQYPKNTYTQRLHTKSSCGLILHQCAPGISTISKRYKQTSSNQGKSSDNVSETIEEPTEKLSVFKRYKKMLKEYWYVLLPVHCLTSVFWFGGFYYAAKCGIDIVPFLEFINVPEKFIKPLRNSSLGYIAVASAFYKVATPARYMVTLGGTTVAVKVLTKRGLIRPAPTKSELKTIIQNRLKKETSGKQT